MSSAEITVINGTLGTSTAQLVLAWMIFSFCLIAITFILIYMIRDFVLSTRKTFVLKDAQSMMFVAYTLIAMGFKIFCVNFYYSKRDNTDLIQCNYFLVDFIPQMFELIGIFIILIKIVLLQMIVRDSPENYKRYQKGRLTIATFFLRVLQLIVVFILVLKAIGSCNYKNWSILTLDSQVEQCIIYGFKTMFFVLISFGLFDIGVKENAEKLRKTFLIYTLIMISLILGQIIIIGVVGTRVVVIGENFNFEATYFVDILVIVYLAVLCIYLR